MNHNLSGRILVVDDDPGLLKLLTLRLEGFGHEVRAVDSAPAALCATESFSPDTVITDLRMQGMDGIELLEAIHQRQPGLPVLIITAHGTIPDAVNATQRGAVGFLTKPIEKQLLQEKVLHALRLSPTSEYDNEGFREMVSRSPLMREVLRRARRAARSDSNVLITGQSGTGKELLARAIHNAGPRREQPFMAVNCGAIPAELYESELFGHERGAFTGAHRSREGIFQAANGGTLFLDEVGDMAQDLQIKLLRALQEREIRRVGSNTTVVVDVRIIAATHQNLDQMTKVGRFREDLYYRLNVVALRMPALDERREDIPCLVNEFLERIAAQRSEPRKLYAPEALEMLVRAQWPGNIRHLFNVVEQNVVLSTGSMISAADVVEALAEGLERVQPLARARDEFTQQYLSRLLQLTGGNVTRAARLAQRNRTDFYKLLSRHHLDPAAFKYR